MNRFWVYRERELILKIKNHNSAVVAVDDLISSTSKRLDTFLDYYLNKILKGE